MTTNSPTKKPETCVIYYRTSHDPANTRNQVDTYREELVKEAEARGLKILAEYEDNDVPAFRKIKSKPRHGFLNLLSDVRARRVTPDVVLVNEISRLLRREDDKREVEETLIEPGIGVVSLHDGVDTTADDLAAKIGWHVMTSVAITAGKAMGQKIAAAHEHEAKLGRARTMGPPPYGYRPSGTRLGRNGEERAASLEIYEPEAAIIRECYRRILNDNHSVSSIVNDLNRRGVPTARKDKDGRPTAARWTQLTLKRLLTRATLAGVRELPIWKLGQPVDGNNLIRPKETERAWDAIVSVDDLLRLRMEMNRRAREYAAKRHTDTVGTYLLSSLVTCPSCRKRMHVCYNSEKKQVMIRCGSGTSNSCRATGKGLHMRYDYLEAVVLAATAQALRDGAVLAMRSELRQHEDLGELQRNIEKNRNWLKEQAALFARRAGTDDEMSQEEYDAMVGEKRRQLKRDEGYLSEKLREAQLDLELPDDLAERPEHYLAHMPVAWQRRVIQTVWETIEVLAPKRPAWQYRLPENQAERVRLTPRLSW